jgi:hypothetical protein
LFDGEFEVDSFLGVLMLTMSMVIIVDVLRKLLELFKIQTHSGENNNTKHKGVKTTDTA